jgi:hypothetical protein
MIGKTLDKSAGNNHRWEIEGKGEKGDETRVEIPFFRGRVVASNPSIEDPLNAVRIPAPISLSEV